MSPPSRISDTHAAGLYFNPANPEQEAQTPQQKLDALNEEYAAKVALNDQAHANYISAQNTANNALNAARAAGLMGNREQIAIEASKEINSFSIIKPDPLRNVDSLDHEGKNSYKHLTNAIDNLVPVIFQENETELNRLREAIAAQEAVVKQK